MITQQLFDTLASLLANLWSLLPPLPTAFETVFAQAITGIQTVMHSIANLGPIIPFGLISGLLGVWVGCLAFWVAVALFKLILKVVGR